MDIAFILLGWVFSVCVHEYAHALTAWHGGDRTVEDKGYLDFNPFAYVDPFLSIGLPLIFLLMGGIPLMGGAVYIDRSRLLSRHWEAAVSLAGPVGNFALALVLAAPFQLGLIQAEDSLAGVFAVLIYLNIFIGMLNLLPVPGIDGFGIIRPYLPIQQQLASDGLAQYGFFILFGLLLAFPQITGKLSELAILSILELNVPGQSLLVGFESFSRLRLR